MHSGGRGELADVRSGGRGELADLRSGGRGELADVHSGRGGGLADVHSVARISLPEMGTGFGPEMDAWAPTECSWNGCPR